MDADLIERLAREADLAMRDVDQPGLFARWGETKDLTPYLHRFAAALAEECAKVCYEEGERLAGIEHQDDGLYGQAAGCFASTILIREKFAP